ncbi:MAG: hypothetical protein IKE31_09790 [Eubacterium sp.]|nr:hypothetical protein [Eubacterium sp.]
MKTDTIIRKEGMNALLEKLGHVDAERFIALVIREPIDYTEWRRENLKDEDVRTLSSKAMEYSKTLA